MTEINNNILLKEEFNNFNKYIKTNKKYHNHDKIKDKLIYLNNNNKIPNIIFYGDKCCGKKTILKFFINIIYNNDQELIKNNILIINCAFNKGIKYIREDLKFFCKTIINYDNGNFFKSIILLNADKLTIDAQSALRRCIEIYNHNTRFFIIVENINKLLKPIISRFASIYVINYQFNKNNTINYNQKNYIDNKINKLSSISDINDLVNILYNNGYNAIDIYNYIIHSKFLENFDNLEKNLNKYNILLNFLEIKKEIRNEKILMFYLIKNLFTL